MKKQRHKEVKNTFDNYYNLLIIRHICALHKVKLV